MHFTIRLALALLASRKARRAYRRQRNLGNLARMHRAQYAVSKLRYPLAFD